MLLRFQFFASFLRVIPIATYKMMPAANRQSLDVIEVLQIKLYVFPQRRGLPTVKVVHLDQDANQQPSTSSNACTSSRSHTDTERSDRIAGVARTAVAATIWCPGGTSLGVGRTTEGPFAVIDRAT